MGGIPVLEEPFISQGTGKRVCEASYRKPTDKEGAFRREGDGFGKAVGYGYIVGNSSDRLSSALFSL